VRYRGRNLWITAEDSLKAEASREIIGAVDAFIELKKKHTTSIKREKITRKEKKKII
jgi:hypothetical protein